VNTVLRATLALIAVALAGAASAAPAPLTPAERAAVSADVRAFMLKVASEVTQHGPTAWRAQFSQTPQFFMAVNGALAFADSAAASRGIAALPGIIQSIELKWGDDLRIDPLTAQFAVVASSYYEMQTHPDGTRTADRGYFTAVAERGAPGWTLRDAHWSSLTLPGH
jgi:hypothetical protein